MAKITYRRNCHYPNCKETTTRGLYCKEHAPYEIDEKAVYRFNKKGYKKDKNISRLYGQRWRKYRISYLRSHPVCVECGREATEIDHIIPHKGDVNLFWDEGNMRPMCHSCHSRKTLKEMMEYKGKVAVKEEKEITFA